VRVLGVGIATLDLVSVVESYPAEDAEVRALERYRRRGGNCTSTLAVLAQLGHEVHWVGTVADDADARDLLAAAAREGIDTSRRVTCAGGRTPVSHVVLSRATGSRTIVHHRDLPELSAADFAAVPLQGIDWVHFEGRAVPALGTMIERVRDFGTRCSLEIEKPRAGIEALFGAPDLLLFSRGYAQHRGYAGAGAFLRSLPRRPGQVLCCAWGADGAWAVDEAGDLHHSPAFRPPALVDTLGAGDVLNAGCIDGVLRGFSVAATLREACRIAGRKCGSPGLAGLARTPGSEVALCRLDELPDPGSRGLLLPLADGTDLSGFLVRHGDRVRAYRNACPHTGAPLEWRPHQFLDADGRLIQCALHGALFTPEDGQCVRGPCAGDALEPVPVAVRDGWVAWRVPAARTTSRGSARDS
jgi:ketohexokinase